MGMGGKLKVDKNLLILLALLLVAGIFLQYTANYPGDQTFFKNHLMWIVISLVLGFLVLFYPLNGLKDIAIILYIVGIILLAIVPFLPKSEGRWIKTGGFQFQPSEVMKLFFIIFISKIFSKFENKNVTMRDLRLPIIIAAIPVLLVFIEPDIGTASIFLFVFLGIVGTLNISIPRYILLVSPLISLLCGFHLVSWILFMIMLVAVIIISDVDLRFSIGVFLMNLAVGASTPILDSLLKPYQKTRLLTFLNPSLDPTGAGWQLLQSKISIGSGGFFGKGYLNGSIKNLGFLPQTRTDFIFAVLGEEFGFLGTIALLTLFTLFLLRILHIARRAQRSFGKYLAYGIFFYFLSQITVNIAMTIGLLPVVGLPLPFISYGGTSLVVSTVMVALLILVKNESIV
ncbi:MAG: FtsW/RodA/SpoVE family cell cycle protein [candidate division WOR-3 bacterium]